MRAREVEHHREVRERGALRRRNGEADESHPPKRKEERENEEDR